MISGWSATQFSLTFSESTGVVCTEDSIHHLWKQFRKLFLSGQWLTFLWLLMSRKGLCGLMNPFVTCESSFGGYLWVAATQFSLTVYESAGAVWDDKTFVTCESSFGGYFLVVSYSVFLDFFWVNRCCTRWGFLVSSLETVLVTISVLAAT